MEVIRSGKDIILRFEDPEFFYCFDAKRCVNSVEIPLGVKEARQLKEQLEKALNEILEDYYRASLDYFVWRWKSDK